MRRQNNVAQHLTRILLKQIIDHAKITQRLRHLFAINIDKAIVQPVIGKWLTIMCTATLGNLILMMRENQILPTSMDINGHT